MPFWSKILGVFCPWTELISRAARYQTGNEIGNTRHDGPGSVIPDLIRDRDDGSGIQAVFLDSGVRQNDIGSGV